MAKTVFCQQRVSTEKPSSPSVWPTCRSPFLANQLQSASNSDKPLTCCSQAPWQTSSRSCSV